jgi:hypothetical protein
MSKLRTALAIFDFKLDFKSNWELDMVAYDCTAESRLSHTFSPLIYAFPLRTHFLALWLIRDCSLARLLQISIHPIGVGGDVVAWF